MIIQRTQKIEGELEPGRVLIIYGPRRVGKTTMLRGYLSTLGSKKVFSGQGDDIKLQELFSAQERNRLLEFARPWEVIAIDEAQQIPKIGIGIKMINDEYPNTIIILTGSSSFELAGQVGEPLTGRHFVMTLLPIALAESGLGVYDLRNRLEDFLIYGCYPEVLLAETPEKRTRILQELLSSYLYKDILALDKVRSPAKLRDLARAIALQTGNDVSLGELASTVGLDAKTVARYLDVLEKMFVIKRVGGLSRNLRSEISSKARYFFLDTGVRNAVLDAFQPLSLRADIGGLWENFVFAELYKDSMRGRHLSDIYYFWRTHGGAEVDIVRERAGKLTAIECKWSKFTLPGKAWRDTYPESETICITKHNFPDFLL